MEDGISGLLITVITNTTVFVIALVFFLLYRSLRSQPIFSSEKLSGPPFPEGHISISEAIQKLYSTSDHELGIYCKMDGSLYLTLIRRIGYLFFFFSIIGLAGLVPIYMTGNRRLQQKESPFYDYSIAHVSGYDTEMILPSVCAILFSIGSYVLVYTYYGLTKTRELSLTVNYIQPETNEELYAKMCTIQISNIPKRISPFQLNKITFNHINNRYADAILAVNVVPNLTHLLSLCSEEEKIKKKLDRFKFMAKE